MNSKEFDVLRTKWYNILQESGFQDIENDIDGDQVKQRTSLKGELRGRPYNSEVQKFYHECQVYLDSPEMQKLENLWLRLIFGMFIEGNTIRQISAKLRQAIDLLKNYPKETSYVSEKQFSVFKVHGELTKLVQAAKEYNYKNREED